jgi:hypothetical protein
MVMAFRYRTVWNNPALRNNSTQGDSGGTAIGDGGTPKENTTEQIPGQSVHTVYALPASEGANVQVIQHDANTNGGQLLIQQITSAGAQDTTKPVTQLSQNDLGTVDDEGSTGRVAKWRKFVVLDAATGEPYQVVIAASAEEDTDVTISGGMNYRGTWSSSTAYNLEDVVRVLSGANQGVWVCVTANTNEAPVWPEPTSGTVYWNMLAFGALATSVCDGGSKTSYVNATPPS